MPTKEQYWRSRTVKRLVEAEKTGAAAAKQTLDIYDQALKNIERDIRSIYDNYVDKGILQVSELKKALGPDGAKRFKRELEKKAAKLNLNPDKIYDERYLSRLSRLDAIKEQIKLEAMTIAPGQERLSKRAYAKILKDGYSATQKDMRLVGVDPTFSTLDGKVLDKILTSVWQGSNYSNRVWGNTEKLAARLPTIIGGALNSGQSYAKTVNQVRQEFDVGRFEATRLVRTETNYFYNQAEIQSYVDDGIEEYTLDVTLDGRTSQICLHVDESKRYSVNKAVTGSNYPPLHPQCRTVPRAVLTDDPEPAEELKDRVKRFARFDDATYKEKFQKAMQAQMDPNKAVHDYNAEMNILTQNLKNGLVTQDLFKQQLGQLMATIPSDYPLRPALENMAKLNGWVPETTKFLAAGGTGSAGFLNRNPKMNAVRSMLEDADLLDAGINFTEDQDRFIVDKGIKIRNLRSGTDDLGGSYDYDTNTIAIDATNVRSFGNQLDQKGYINAVVQHELGHAVDRVGFRGTEHSQTDQFKQTLDTVDAYNISKYRLAKGLADKDVRDFFANLTPEAYGNAAQSGETVSINGVQVGVPREAFSYHIQPDELFAEAYAIYHSNPKWLQANIPKAFDYFTSTFGNK